LILDEAACDHHPASIARYRAFLAEKHGTVAALDACYSRNYGSIAEVDPPRRFEADATFKDNPTKRTGSPTASGTSSTTSIAVPA